MRAVLFFRQESARKPANAVSLVRCGSVKKGTQTFSIFNEVEKETFITKIETMPIPDEVFFGLDKDGKDVTFGNIREILSKKESGYELHLIELLRLRLTRVFNEPTQRVKTNKDSYLLANLTCSGIELLGQIFHPTSGKEKSKPFREVCSNLHLEFGKSLPSTFKEKLSKMWSLNTEIDKIDSLSYLLYTYLRNQMTHYFIAKGVYLSYEKTNTFEIVETENEAYLIINPEWYWDSYLEVFNDYFYNKVKNKKEFREKALRYIEKAIK